MLSDSGGTSPRPKRNLRLWWGLGLFILGILLIVYTKGPGGGQVLFAVALVSVVTGGVLLELP